jgi:hypothetical protein
MPSSPSVPAEPSLPAPYAVPMIPTPSVPPLEPAPTSLPLPPASPPLEMCPAELDALRLETRDAHAYAFYEHSSGTFTPGRFSVIDRTSSLQTRVRGDDTTVWYSQSVTWPKNDAAGGAIRAVVGTSTLARPQQVRVMYQLRDEHGNSRVNSVGVLSVHYAGGSIGCAAPDTSSGIGECSGTLAPSVFESAGPPIPLSLHWPDASTVAVPNFGSVQPQREPSWSQAGGWNSAGGVVSEAVAFGAVLPYEDMYISVGGTRAIVTAKVYLKTHMAEDSAAEREVAVGKLKLVYPSSACSVTGDSGRHGAFDTWEVVGGLGGGEYGLVFRNGQIEGHAVLMVSISLSCEAGTHAIGVETMEFSDSNGLSSAPYAEYATSVGRADGYVARASVHVRQASAHVAAFAYASDGRASVNNLLPIGGPPPTVEVRLDSVSDSPYAGRHTNAPCVGECTYVGDAGASGVVSLSVGVGGGASDSLDVHVVRPSVISLSADDTRLSAIGCPSGGGSIGYESTQLRLWVDGLDMTALATYTSSDASIAEVLGSRVLGRGIGEATIVASGGAAQLSVSVEGGVVRPELVARVVTSVGVSSRLQSFMSEDDVGYLYVYANTSSGDAWSVSVSELSVEVVDDESVTYDEVGLRGRVGVVANAASASSCDAPLLRVALGACTSLADAF